MAGFGRGQISLSNEEVARSPTLWMVGEAHVGAKAKRVWHAVPAVNVGFGRRAMFRIRVGFRVDWQSNLLMRLSQADERMCRW